LGRSEPPLAGRLAPVTAAPSNQARTSGLAIASLICGTLGFLCLPGLAGVVLGIIALLKINKSQGRLRGQGLAIGGICLSAFMLLAAVPIGAAVMLPALAKAKGRAQQFNRPGASARSSHARGEAGAVYCVNNLKQMCLAARMYSSDHQNTFPPDVLSMSNYLGSPKLLVCRADKNHTAASAWAEFDPANNLTYEYLKPGIEESNALPEVIFRCPIHNNVGLGDGSVHQGLGRPR